MPSTATPSSGSDSSSATAADHPAPSTAKVWLRRVLIAVGLILVLLIPAGIMLVVVTAVTGHSEPAATWAAMPAIAGIAAVATGGVSLGIRVAIVMALLAPISIVAGATPMAGAALMALMCLMVGYLSRFGLHRAAMLVPIFIAWTTINPPYWGVDEKLNRLDNTYLSWMVVIFFVGAIFPVLVLPFALRKMKHRPPQTHSQHEAIVYTVMITLLTSIGTYYALAHPKDFAGAFLVAAILVLAPIGTADAFVPTVKRMIGTVLGSIFVIAIVSQVHSLGLVYLIGAAFGVAAVVSKLSSRTIVYYVLMVPTAACLNALTTTQVGQLGEQRVVDNVVGGVLVLLAIAISLGYSRIASRHSASSGDAPTPTPAAA